jgi:4-amino-4-deoxy-L-arabinose transferase-like glycosyltransferase
MKGDQISGISGTTGHSSVDRSVTVNYPEGSRRWTGMTGSDRVTSSGNIISFLGPLVLAALLLFFPGIHSTPFRDPDEGLYGAIAREMVDRGDWLTPRFNGLPYLEKPPLYHWLTGLTYLAFGYSEWGARLWAALGALGTVILTALMGREAFGPKVGFMGGLICATSLGVFFYSRFVGVDPLFIAFLTMALFCTLRWVRRGGALPVIGAYVGVALAVMTKGLLGLLFPVVIIGGTILLLRHRLILRGFPWWGLVLLAGLVLPWHVLVSRANPGFLRYYLLETHLVRFLQGTGAIEDEVPLSVVAFLLVSLVWFLPWSLFLPTALFDLCRRWKHIPSPEQHAWTMVLVWAAAVLALFSLSSYRLEHYALPAIPALALLVAGLCSRSSPGWLLGAPLTLGTVGALGLAVVAYMGGRVETRELGNLLSSFAVYFRMLLEEGSSLPIPSPDILWPLFQKMSLALLFGFGAAAAALWWGAVRAAFGCLILGTVGLFLAVGGMMAAVAPYQSVKNIAFTIRQLASPADLVLYEGYLENAAGLPFYTARQIHVLGSPRGDLAFGARSAVGRELFHSAQELSDLWQGARRLFLVTDRPSERSAARTLPEETAYLLVLDHGKRLYSNRPGRLAGVATGGNQILP